jgi:hypothetical protein
MCCHTLVAIAKTDIPILTVSDKFNGFAGNNSISTIMAYITSRIISIVLFVIPLKNIFRSRYNN